MVRAAKTGGDLEFERVRDFGSFRSVLLTQPDLGHCIRYGILPVRKHTIPPEEVRVTLIFRASQHERLHFYIHLPPGGWSDFQFDKELIGKNLVVDFVYSTIDDQERLISYLHRL